MCAASGTVLFHLRGGASSLIRGGLRLVLAGFLLSVSLWAVDGVIGSFISDGSYTACQIAVALASAFDQIARISLEEYLLWAIKHDLRAALGIWLPQILIFLRFILGGILVGVHRPQMAPICVATVLLWQIGVAVAIADATVVLMLLTKASSVGIFRDLKVDGPIGFRARGLTFTTIALGLWIAVSLHYHHLQTDHVMDSFSFSQSNLVERAHDSGHQFPWHSGSKCASLSRSVTSYR